MRYKIIVNPSAGKKRAAQLIPQLQGLLAEKGISYQLVQTTGPGHATELARTALLEGWPAIVAVGGDGTVNEVINGLTGSSVPLAIIPAGTGNDLARSLKLPKSLVSAVEVLTNPGRLSMDLGQDGEHSFACIAGIGFPADVMYNVNLSKGIFSGSLAITWGIIKTLKELTPIRVVMELDGEIHQANAQGVFVLNTVYAGGGIKFSPQADITDGLLDVLVMRDMSWREVLAVLPRVYRGTHLSHPKVDFYRAKEVIIKTETPVRKMFDGNIVGQSPINARVSPWQLQVIVPKGE